MDRIKPTIKEILDHHLYREFAAACTECGKCLLPDSHPWRWMGISEADWERVDLRYESGQPMSARDKAAQLVVVRQMGREVVTWWSWWLGWEYLSRGRARAGVAPAPAVPKASPGMLFWSD